MKTAFICLNILISLAFTVKVYAQNIDELAIIPENPSNNDNIELIVTAWIPTFPCSLVSSNMNVMNDTAIYINIYYYNSVFATTSECLDTLTIGYLNPGTYFLNVITHNDGNFDSKDTVFTVDFIDGINEAEKNTTILIAYPNPSSEKAFINISPKLLLNARIEEIQLILYDINGRSLNVETEIKSGNTITINSRNLLPGIYFFKLTDNKRQPLAKGKLIVQ